MRRRCTLLVLVLEWQLTAAPVLAPALAEYRGTQLSLKTQLGAKYRVIFALQIHQERIESLPFAIHEDATAVVYRCVHDGCLLGTFRSPRQKVF
jgi:hypothetical protein